MPFPLWVAAVSFAAMTVVLLSVVWPRGLRVVAAAAVAGAAAWAVLTAETPFGIGDGVVPDVRGRGFCGATTVLQERGLRWRSFAAVASRVHPRECAGAEEDPANPVVEQQPAPGTDLGEGGIVRLRYACEPPGCALG